MKRKYFEKEVNEENIYLDKARELLLEDGELSPEEEGFMKGYSES